MSSDEILIRAFGVEYQGEDVLLRTYLSRLRSKIGKGIILSFEHFGYKLALDN